MWIYAMEHHLPAMGQALVEVLNEEARSDTWKMRRLGESQRMRWSRVCCSSRESPGLARRCRFIRWGCCCCCCCMVCPVLSSAGVTDTGSRCGEMLGGCYILGKRTLKQNKIWVFSQREDGILLESDLKAHKCNQNVTLETEDKHLSPSCGGGIADDPASVGNHSNRGKTNVCCLKTLINEQSQSLKLTVHIFKQLNHHIQFPRLFPPELGTLCLLFLTS